MVEFFNAREADEAFDRAVDAIMFDYMYMGTEI